MLIVDDSYGTEVRVIIISFSLVCLDPFFPGVLKSLKSVSLFSFSAFIVDTVLDDILAAKETIFQKYSQLIQT